MTKAYSCDQPPVPKAPPREVAVTIKFDLTSLTKDQKTLLWSAAKALGACGIGFDTGSDGKTLDWEWDWSLSGPVRVFFRNFVEEDPTNRYTRQKKLDIGERCASLELVETMVGELQPAKPKS